MPAPNPKRDAALEELFQAVLSLQDIDECRAFFNDLFTMQELINFSNRLQVAKLLLNGETYQTVRSRISVSSSTITRINTELQFGSGGYHSVLSRLAKGEAASEGTEEPAT